MDYAEQMRRKRMLIAWLTETIHAESLVIERSKIKDGTSIDILFKHVTDGRLDKAVQCALENGKWRRKLPTQV